MYIKYIWDLGCSGGAEKSFTIVSSRREKKHGDGAFMVFPRFKKWHVWENIFPEANSHRNSLGALQGLVVNIDKKKLKLAGSEFVGKRGRPSTNDGRRSKSASSQATFWVKFL